MLGDGTRVVLHDDRSGEALALGEREWSVVAAMDGTRDARGIAAAAGARVGVGAVEAFVTQLAALGLLASHVPAAPGAPSFARDVPVRVLPGWGYRCDGRGGCCRTFSTVLFSPLEAAVARATLPDHHDAGHAPDRFFTPERGLDQTLLAGPCERGHCAYLDDRHRCRLHAAAGPSAKPRGCRTFPLRFLDVGTHIRCAPRLECACPFVPADDVEGVPATGADLPREVYVPRLEVAPLEVGADDSITVRDLVDWLDALPAPDDDGAGYLEWVAHHLRSRGLAAIGPRPAASSAPVDSPLMARAARLARQRASLALPDDLVHDAARWIADALPTGRERPAAGEALYARALLYAPPDDTPLSQALLQAAGRLRVARALRPEALSTPSVASPPIALLAAMARGYGLD